MTATLSGERYAEMSAAEQFVLTLSEKGFGKRLDLSLVAAGVLLLWVAGLLATFFPALKGARVAPAVATRNV